MTKLLEAIDRKAADLQLTQEQLASCLGISDTYLTLLKQGKREPGNKFLRAVIQAFPDLQLLVFEYLATPLETRAI